MGQESAAHHVTTSFVKDGQELIAGITEATEEAREAQQMQNDLNYANLLSKVPALSGAKGKTPAEQEEAKYEAFAKIQIGRELGLKPAESMRAVFFGQGGPDIDIHTRVMLAMRTGRYKFDIVQLDQNRCEVVWYRKESGQWMPQKPVVATIDQIKHIDIWENGKQKKLADKWNYKSWREDMLYAFTQRRAVRRYAPETQGSFVPQPANEEAYEDAGMRTTDKLTPAEQATNIADFSGDPTPTADLNAARDKLQELRTLIAAEERKYGLILQDRKAWLHHRYGSVALEERDKDELREILDHVRELEAEAYLDAPDKPIASDNPSDAFVQEAMFTPTEAEEKAGGPF